MKIQNLCRGGWGSSCYYLCDDSYEHAVIIDPSAPPACLPLFPNGRKPELCAILLTHTHYDHMLALPEWRRTGAPLYVTEADAPGLADPVRNVSRLICGEDKTFLPAEKYLYEGDCVSFGDETLRVLLTPGHTPGSCCYLGRDALFCGDTLFAGGGYGRCDLPGGSFTAIQSSVRRLMGLEPSLTVYPGHGAPTTIGSEKQYHGL